MEKDQRYFRRHYIVSFKFSYLYRLMPHKMTKSSAKITRVQLKINQNNESVLVGIVSTEPDYKLSLTLNRKLKISLKNIKPLTIPHEDGTEIAFSRFSDSSLQHGQTYDLISNRCEKNFLLRKLKNIDYIFQIHNPENKTSLNKIISMIRGTESVTAVLNINTALIKDKNLHYIIQ